MAVTALQFLNGPLRWKMFEKGLQVEWNRLYQLLTSQAGSGVTAGTTVLATLDVTDGAGTGFQKDAGVTVSGPFATTGAEATVKGEKVVESDPAGHYGPTPARRSQDLPMAGFKTA